ncbi:MAG: ATP-binding protein, partial [Bacteroidota bacterium]
VEQARRETEEKAGELERANALKSRFLANISHEFRTPLTLTFGPLDDLLDGRFQVEEAARPHLERARRNGGRLLRLINQLLDLSKLDAGALLLRPAHGDLAGHLRQIATLFESVAQRRQITFTVEGVEQPRAFVYDADKIEKVVVNLLSNAFKFTQPGGTIVLRLAEENGGVRIDLADSGPGIPPEHLPFLFDRFYQAESGTTRAQEGTGIGLALAQDLVELHGGTIAVESTEGVGTTFSVSLPDSIALPEIEARATSNVEEVRPPVGSDGSDAEASAWLVEEAAYSADQASASSPAATPGEASPSEQREEEDQTLVLVAEDNPDMRAYIRSHLDDAFTVIEAENGRVGVERALELVPDLVLSDVMMPELDGLDLTAALKADARTSHVPVVLLTARADVADRIAGYEAGADAYLPKPFSAAELRVRVRTLIAERRRLQARFSAAAGLSPETPPYQLDVDAMGKPQEGPELPPLPAREVAFLSEVDAVVADRLADPEFGVDALAEALAMSPRQVLRKLKALTGETTARLIRRRRMEYAATALASGADSVKTVAFEAGFTNDSAFTRAFGQYFGVTPSVYAERHGLEENDAASDGG